MCTIKTWLLVRFDNVYNNKLVNSILSLKLALSKYKVFIIIIIHQSI